MLVTKIIKSCADCNHIECYASDSFHCLATTPSKRNVIDINIVPTWCPLHYDLINQIRGAVARGWCTKENSAKVMDAVLAEAISQSVFDFMNKMDS